MAKIEIPDALKADIPQTKWGRLLTATPIIMTVIATALAGLASSEMTRAQYSRSLAAQQQSKAGDQWGFFQAKRLRGALQRNTIDVLEATTDIHPLDLAALTDSNVTMQGSSGQQAIMALGKGELPAIPTALATNLDLTSALSAIENQRPESEINRLVAKLNDKELDAALAEAKDHATAFDDAMKPVNHAVDMLEKQVLQHAVIESGSVSNVTGVAKSVSRDFTVARLRYTALRYDAEARLNQAIGTLYEVQVRKSNLDADRHHKRSQKFFFGMLAAQMAVIISTFAIAAQKRNFLWSLAAAAGAAAVAFAVYVYLYV